MIPQRPRTSKEGNMEIIKLLANNISLCGVFVLNVTLLLSDVRVSAGHVQLVHGGE